MDAEHAAYPASDDEDMTWFHPSAQEGLSFTRFCMNSYYAVMEFERCLRRALQVILVGPLISFCLCRQ